MPSKRSALVTAVAASRKATTATQERNAAIIAAQKAGTPVSVIATATSLTRQRIYQIVRKDRAGC